jgi:hypothetical protein
MTNRPVRPQAFRSSGRLLPGPGPVQVMRTTGEADDRTWMEQVRKVRGVEGA